MDWPHPDLYANIWHNWKEINNNWAGDPYAYDSIGWDFGGGGDAEENATPDNNPIEDVPVHGTLVAGTADAVTNNGIGVAGIGYKCKIMAVKVSQANLIDSSTGDPYIVYGAEGIQYAAENGAKVINCSWGGYGYSNAEQAALIYAQNNGALSWPLPEMMQLQNNFIPLLIPVSFLLRLRVKIIIMILLRFLKLWPGC